MGQQGCVRGDGWLASSRAGSGMPGMKGGWGASCTGRADEDHSRASLCRAGFRLRVLDVHRSGSVRFSVAGGGHRHRPEAGRGGDRGACCCGDVRAKVGSRTVHSGECLRYHSRRLSVKFQPGDGEIKGGRRTGRAKPDWIRVAATRASSASAERFHRRTQTAHASPATSSCGCAAGGFARNVEAPGGGADGRGSSRDEV